MTRCRFIAAAVLIGLLTGPSLAQTNQLRGLPQSGVSRLPSAQQQLNQNLNRQQNGFSTRQQIDSSNRLNRTEQINRNNTRPDTTTTPCAGANETCRNND
ncbi:hypothetical protein [Roseibium sp. M-1]